MESGGRGGVTLRSPSVGRCDARLAAKAQCTESPQHSAPSGLHQLQTASLPEVSPPCAGTMMEKPASINWPSTVGFRGPDISGPTWSQSVGRIPSWQMKALLEVDHYLTSSFARSFFYLHSFTGAVPWQIFYTPNPFQHRPLENPNYKAKIPTCLIVEVSLGSHWAVTECVSLGSIPNLMVHENRFWENKTEKCTLLQTVNI